MKPTRKSKQLIPRGVAIIILAMQNGCCGVSKDVGADEWFYFSVDVAFSQNPETEIRDFWEVSASSLDVAEYLLEIESCIGVTSGMFGLSGTGQDSEVVGMYFGARGVTTPANTRLFLVRAMYMKHGGFSVYYENDRLLVLHGTMGASDVPVKHSALLIALPDKPSDVCVHCRMVE